MEENTTNAQPAKNGLVVLLTENKISEEIAVNLAPAFLELFDQATEWNKKAVEYINDKNISAEEKAKECRKARLALVKVRTGIDKKRKELNEDDQERITSRNKAGKILTELTTPTEALLLEQEEALEREEQRKRDLIRDARKEKLSPYNVDTTYFDLVNMPDETFEALLNNSKLAFESKIENEKKAEIEKLKAEKILARQNQIYTLGFQPNFLENTYSHLEYNITISDGSVSLSIDEVWNKEIEVVKNSIKRIKEEKENAAKIETDRLAQENAKLQAEKDELERKEKATKLRHETGLSRQKSLGEIGVNNTDFDILADMTAPEWNLFFGVKNSEYQAEQNRIFIEKKKKEFEEAQALKLKQDKEAEEKRLELAPDKEKLLDVVNSITIKSNNYKSNKAIAIEIEIFAKFEAFKKWATEQINTLK